MPIVLLKSIHYSLEINPLFSMKNVYIALENNQEFFGIFLFLLELYCIGAHNWSKMLKAGQHDNYCH